MEAVVTSGLGEIDADAREVIEGCLRVARQRLDMDIAWLAEFTAERKVLRVVEGDNEAFDLWDDSWLPLTETYCNRMMRGEIPNAIPDTAAEPAVATLPVTEQLGIEAYVGVPLLLPGGELRGALCCAKSTPSTTLSDRDVEFMRVMARVVADEIAYREALRRMHRLELRSAAAEALCSALEARDDYTSAHSQAVVELAGAVARRLGCDEDTADSVERVALLHDIGKVAIPDSILRKPGPLSDDEWTLMRTHPERGAEILRRSSALAELAPAVRAEHERWDGTGYPDGLAGESIPLASRIVLVCDGYHAMVSDRPYRPAMAADAAVAELRRCSGSMFWPDAVDALLVELEEAA
jgi:putative nucleotidyltransferase with HDIG domain